MSHDIFISYAHTSALQNARALREALEAAGVHVFLDERSILPGTLDGGAGFRVMDEKPFLR